MPPRRKDGRGLGTRERNPRCEAQVTCAPRRTCPSFGVPTGGGDMAVKTFEQYLAEWQADARPLRDEPYEKCDNCGGPHPVTRDGVCRECLHYFHGHDEAHDKLVDSIVGSAVKR